LEEQEREMIDLRRDDLRRNPRRDAGVLSLKVIVLDDVTASDTTLRAVTRGIKGDMYTRGPAAFLGLISLFGMVTLTYC
jgi:hypothetical protein